MSWTFICCFTCTSFLLLCPWRTASSQSEGPHDTAMGCQSQLLITHPIYWVHYWATLSPLALAKWLGLTWTHDPHQAKRNPSINFPAWDERIELPLFSSQRLWRWRGAWGYIPGAWEKPQPSEINHPKASFPNPKVFEYIIMFSFLPNMVWAKLLLLAIKVPWTNTIEGSIKSALLLETSFQPLLPNSSTTSSKIKQLKEPKENYNGWSFYFCPCTWPSGAV